jgi:eukaryotic-like serine/threonine-protein kinase
MALPPSRKPNRVKRFVVLSLRGGLLLLALASTVVVSALTTMRALLSAQVVAVPSLVGKPLPEAGSVAARRRLHLRVEGKRHDPKVQPDRIAAQDPPPGAALKTHRSIRIWISLGPRRIAIPAVEGQGIRTARVALDQAGVGLGRVVEVDDPTAEGTIVSQHPQAGSVDEADPGVSVLVSRGTAGLDYLMPDLIGRPADGAMRALARYGLKVADVRYRSYPGVAAGIVIRQTPPAGHRVDPSMSLALDVSKVEP